MKWHPGPPTTRQRIVWGIYLVAFVIVSVAKFAEWRIFGGYEPQVWAVALSAGLLMARFYLPAVHESD